MMKCPDVRCNAWLPTTDSVHDYIIETGTYKDHHSQCLYAGLAQDRIISDMEINLKR